MACWMDKGRNAKLYGLHQSGLWYSFVYPVVIDRSTTNQPSFQIADMVHREGVKYKAVLWVLSRVLLQMWRKLLPCAEYRAAVVVVVSLLAWMEKFRGEKKESVFQQLLSSLLLCSPRLACMMMVGLVAAAVAVVGLMMLMIMMIVQPSSSSRKKGSVYSGRRKKGV